MSRPPKWFAAKAGRRDGNHAAIRDGLIALCFFVVDTASVGGGVLDLLAYDRANNPVWIEIKTETGELRRSQLAFIAKLEARGIHHGVARTLDAALELLGAKP